MLNRRLLWVALVSVCFVTVIHAEDFYFESDGVRIHYTVEGKGEPVLLIHGYGANIAMNWAAPGVIKALSVSFQVIAIDNRGHGLSGKPHDANAYGIKMAEDSIHLLDHLKIKRAHIVGYSMGGFIASVILVNHPDRVRTAVLGGAGWTSPEGVAQQREFLKVLADSLEQGKGMGPLIQFLTPVGAPQPTPESIEATNKMFLAFNDPLALAAVARNMDQFTPTAAQIRANKIPVLALIGEVDPLKSGVDLLDGMMPNLKIVVIPKANHMTAFSSPVFVTTLKSFLQEHSTATSGTR